MRRALTYLIVAVVIGGAVGTLMSRDPGYVLVTYADMSVETSLWFALFALLIGYFAVRLIIGAWRWIARGGSGVVNWRENRRLRAARARTLRGLLLVGEGDWAGARKALLADADSAETPLVNYVAAARAANEMNDAAARDELLDRAGRAAPDAALGLALTRAEMQLAAGQFPAARATLSKAKSDAPNHARVLALLTRCHEGLGDWRALLSLADDLQRRGVFGADALRTLRRRWLLSYLGQSVSPADTAQQLNEQWNNVDKELRADPELVTAYARALQRAGAADDAETTLAAGIRQNWDPALVELWGRVGTSQSDRQLRTGEGWLKDRPNDPTLLLALGRIALAGGAWAKAREYFEASLKQQRSADIYAELGRLCRATGETGRAVELLAQAVELSGSLPALPMPQTPSNAVRS